MKTKLLATAICLIILIVSYAQNNQTKSAIKPLGQTNLSKQVETDFSTSKKSTVDTVGKEKCCNRKISRQCCRDTKFPTVISYDFKTKFPEEVPFCTYNQFVIYRINNINRLLYNVKITSDQTTYQSEASGGLSLIFNIAKSNTEDASNASEAVLKEQTDKPTASAIRAISDAEQTIYDKSLIHSTRTSEQDKKKDKNDSITNDSLRSKFNAQNSPKLQLLNQLHTSVIRTIKTYNYLENAKRINNELVAFSTRDIDYKTSSAKVDTVLKKFPSIKYLELILSDFNNNYLELSKNITSYQQCLYDSISENKTRLAKLVLKYKKKTQLKEQETIQQVIQQDSQTLKTLNLMLTEMASLKNKVDNFDFISLFSSLNNILFELKKENNFFFISDPVQVNKDAVNFKIDISSISRVNSASNLDHRSFSAVIPVVGGFKFDFSTGVFLTSGLHDRQYHTSAVSKDSSTISLNQNNNLLNVSLGALMHISKRSNKDWKIGGAIGTGLNSSDLSKVNLFVGASLIIGKQEEFVVTAGIAISQVDYLKSKYTLGKTIENSTIDETLTEKATRFGFFIGFTYNLTSNKKE